MFLHLRPTQTLKLTLSPASEEEIPATLLSLTLRISPPLLGSYRLHLIHQQIVPPPHFLPDLSTQRAGQSEGAETTSQGSVEAETRGVGKAWGA
jgi:hypothetical protein